MTLSDIISDDNNWSDEHRCIVVFDEDNDFCTLRREDNDGRRTRVDVGEISGEVVNANAKPRDDRTAINRFDVERIVIPRDLREVDNSR
jgi:hypothetical protein